MSCLLSHDLSSLGFSDLAEVRAIFPRCEIDPIIQYVVLGPRVKVKVVNHDIFHYSTSFFLDDIFYRFRKRRGPRASGTCADQGPHTVL